MNGRSLHCFFRRLPRVLLARHPKARAPSVVYCHMNFVPGIVYGPVSLDALDHQ